MARQSETDEWTFFERAREMLDRILRMSFSDRRTTATTRLRADLQAADEKVLEGLHFVEEQLTADLERLDVVQQTDARNSGLSRALSKIEAWGSLVSNYLATFRDSLHRFYVTFGGRVWAVAERIFGQLRDLASRLASQLRAETFYLEFDLRHISFTFGMQWSTETLRAGGGSI